MLKTLSIGRSLPISIIAVTTLFSHQSLLAGDVETTIHPPSARGFTVLQATFPYSGDVGNVQVTISMDGETFGEASDGLAGPGQVFWSAYNDDGQTTIVVPSVALFQRGKFRFPIAQTYWVRWLVGISGDTSGGLKFDQVVELGPPSAVDLDFIAGLGEPDLVRAIAGEDFFERQTGNARMAIEDPELLAVMVISRLLLATRQDWPGDVMREAGSRGDPHKAAQILLALAKRFPESSYAPYAAYYAGCCYFAVCADEAQEAVRERKKKGGFENDLAVGRFRVTLLKQNPDSAKTNEAFTLAAQLADGYLKPRVLYQHGMTRLFSFDVDKAERLLMKAVQVAPGDRTIEKWFDKRFGGIDGLHVELEKARELFHASQDTGRKENSP